MACGACVSCWEDRTCPSCTLALDTQGCIGRVPRDTQWVWEQACNGLTWVRCCVSPAQRGCDFRCHWKSKHHHSAREATLPACLELHVLVE